jgi:superfamily II DNA or RNA helicase
MSAEIVLRDYQIADLAAIREEFANYQRVLLTQPTGSGKGTLAAYIVHSAVARGSKVLFLVNRRALVNDMSKRLHGMGLDHGVIMGQDKARRKAWLPVQVASIDTLHRRPNVPAADLIIVDECRFAVSDTWRSVLDRYPDASILGLDATPERSDGRGLGEIFQRIVHGPQVQQLIDKGHLMPSVLMQLPAPDLSGVKNTEAALANAVDKGVLIGDVVSTWLKHASEHKTVVFGVNQAHALHIAEEFRINGVESAYVDCNTDDSAGGERDRIWNDLDNGSLRVVCSVNTISYGWDHPIVSCIVGARPVMKSVADWLQSLGRGSRPHPASGKTHFRIHDHGGNTERLDVLYEDDRHWSLEGKALRSKEDEKVPSVRNCTKCLKPFRSTRDSCPHCGAPVPKSAREVAKMEAELVERKRARREEALEDWKAKVGGDPNKRKYYLELCEVAKQKGYRQGWPAQQFNTRYGHWPVKEWKDEAASLGIMPEPKPLPPLFREGELDALSDG